MAGLPTAAFDALIVAAVVNGALVQIIMASRVLYGLGQEGWLPSVFAMIGARTRTPWLATAAAAAVFAMAVAFPLEGLARLTSWITLLIFVVVNASLLRIRSRKDEVVVLPRMPAAVPLLGLVLSLGLAGFQAAEIARAILR